MVRLKGFFAKQVGVGRANFNSKVVRLKGAVGDCQATLKVIFQFQSGAVKSVCVSSHFTTIGYFNSKVVRLKAPQGELRAAIKDNFNSKVVRLKAVYVQAVANRQQYFNSKVVRLKG